MAQISVSNLTFCYEGSFDNIFENVSFMIDTDWKLGFIGRNGKGKTTFLNLLMGNQKEYQGHISTSTVFDYFPYQVTEQQKEQCCVDFMEEWKTDCELWRTICELEKLHRIETDFGSLTFIRPLMSSLRRFIQSSDFFLVLLILRFMERIHTVLILPP